MDADVRDGADYGAHVGGRGIGDRGLIGRHDGEIFVEEGVAVDMEEMRGLIGRACERSCGR